LQFSEDHPAAMHDPPPDLKVHYSYCNTSRNVWPLALKAQTIQQQFHEYCSLSSNNTMNIWLAIYVIMRILRTDGTNLQ